MQAINLYDSVPVGNIVYGYLRLSLYVNVCVSYLFDMLPVIFPLCLLVTTQIQSMKLQYHHYTIICRNIQSRKVACGTIRRCATNKNYYYINVVCIQLVTH